MATLSLADAARTIGRSKSFLWSAIKNGQVSAIRDDHRRWLIDEAELHRVFPPVSANVIAASAENGVEQAIERLELPALQREVEVLRERFAAAEADKADLRSERDRLLAIIEGQQTRLLSRLEAERPKRRWQLFRRHSQV